MKELSDALSAVSQILSLTVLVGGALYAFFRRAINEYIKIRLTKTVSSELDAERHRFNQEIEALRVSLLRELEQYKANIDIKRTSALRLAESRFDALRNFYTAFDAYTIVCLSWTSMTPEMRASTLSERMQYGLDAKKAHSVCEIFLETQFNAEIFATMRDCTRLAGKFETTSTDRLPPDDQERMALVKQAGDCLTKLRALIHSAPPDLK